MVRFEKLDDGTYIDASENPTASDVPVVFLELTRETILDEASRLTREDRGETYAHPSVNFERIAALWSTYLGVEVTPEQTAVCQMLVKVSRLMASPGHRDSLVDLAGYARTIEMLGEIDA